MRYKKEIFDINRFITEYKKDLDYIFRSLKEEKLEDIVDILDRDSLSIIDKSDIEDKTILELIDSKEYKIFFMVGSVADENETYFRFIDGVQYRIKEGECYEESSEYFNDYKLQENILDLDGFKIYIEDAIGLILYEENDEYIFELCKVDSDTNRGEKVCKSGDFNKLCEEYLRKYKI